MKYKYIFQIVAQIPLKPSHDAMCSRLCCHPNQTVKVVIKEERTISGCIL